MKLSDAYSEYVTSNNLYDKYGIATVTLKRYRNKEFREHALNPEKPAMRGSHENGDVFFQHREACNSVYDALPAVVEKYMAKINEKGDYNDEIEAGIKECIEKFKSTQAW